MVLLQPWTSPRTTVLHSDLCTVLLICLLTAQVKKQEFLFRPYDLKLLNVPNTKDIERKNGVSLDILKSPGFYPRSRWERTLFVFLCIFLKINIFKATEAIKKLYYHNFH